MESEQEAFKTKLRDLGDRFQIRGWDGPCAFSPKETVDEYAHQGKVAPPVWEVFMQKKDEIPDSKDPSGPDLIARAKFRYSEAEAAAVTVEDLARDLALAVAGFEVHEVLERTTFNDQLLIDPHNAKQLAAAAETIAKNVIKRPAD
jgi:hypothetical protein